MRPLLQELAKIFKAERLPEMTQQLDINIARLNDQLVQIYQSLEEGVFIDPQYSKDPTPILVELEGVQEKMVTVTNMAKTYAEYQELFNIECYSFKNLTKAQEALERQSHLWQMIEKWNQQYEVWMNEDFTKIDVEEMNKDVNIYFKESYSFHKKLNNGVTANFKDAVNEHKIIMNPIMELGNPAMRPRHWDKLFKLLGQPW